MPARPGAGMSDALVTVAGALVGLGSSLAVWFAGRPWLQTDGEATARLHALIRKNHAGRPVPASAGLVIVVASVLTFGAASVLGSATDDVNHDVLVRFGQSVAILVLGFGFLGFLDDVLGGPEARGFRGHVRAVAAGRATTGLVKLVGGAAVALAAVSPRADNLLWLVLDAAIVALAANLANLLDRAPGRLLKTSILTALPLCLVGWRGPELAAAAPVFGASWAMLPFDLRERTMLGDAGANVIGAMLGWLAVELTGRPVRLGILAALIVANAASELVSFSRVIEALGPLRWLDGLGRIRPSDTP